MRRGVEAPEGARDLVVAGPPAAPEPEEGRVDAHGGLVTRHVAVDPLQHVMMPPVRVGHLAQVQRKARTREQGDTGGIAVLPREVDAEKLHASGTAMLPSSTVTAEPPTRTRATAPSCSWSSTRSRPGRPRLSPCSAVKATRAPSA